MNDDDRQEFAALMAGVAENFSAQLSGPGIAMRFDALKAYPIDQVCAACAAVVGSRKYTKMPTVADFMEYIGGGNIEDVALVEAGKAIKAVKRVGGYASVTFDNPTTMAVIEHGFGGWVKFCGEMTSENEKWVTRDFVRIYSAYTRQGITLTGILAGRTETHNEAHGRGSTHHNHVLIGDSRKALAISEQRAIAGQLGSMFTDSKSVRAILGIENDQREPARARAYESSGDDTNSNVTRD